jgi:hypothetical protein
MSDKPHLVAFGFSGPFGVMQTLENRKIPKLHVTAVFTEHGH